jgi:hypothetical protein
MIVQEYGTVSAQVMQGGGGGKKLKVSFSRMCLVQTLHMIKIRWKNDYELCRGKDLEVNHSGLFRGTVPAFDLRYSRKARKFIQDDWYPKRNSNRVGRQNHPWSRSWRHLALWDVEFPTFPRQSVHSGNVASLTRRPYFTTRQIPGTHFY